MQLTIKELAPYLPYGLKISSMTGNWDVMTADGNHGIYVSLGVVIAMQSKPILRPLSDLTKEIEHNGERFVPVEEIAIYANTKRGVSHLIEQIRLGWVETIVHNMLCSWHFDVFGLIEKGLAIDMNYETA